MASVLWLVVHPFDPPVFNRILGDEDPLAWLIASEWGYFLHFHPKAAGCGANEFITRKSQGHHLGGTELDTGPGHMKTTAEIDQILVVLLTGQDHQLLGLQLKAAH